MMQPDEMRPNFDGQPRLETDREMLERIDARLDNIETMFSEGLSMLKALSEGGIPGLMRLMKGS